MGAVMWAVSAPRNYPKKKNYGSTATRQHPLNGIMNPKAASKKRKAVTRDVEEEAGVFSGDELSKGNLDGALSDNSKDLSDSEDDDSDSEVELVDDFSDSEDGEDELDSDEIPSDTEEIKPAAGEPNFRIVKDANGNDRYLWDEIHPDDNSELSEVDENANTIGDIPLKFYDEYPHIGYDINGKKIMRPAKGEALDALLDSIEIPKGWTGLTDPKTGKPLLPARAQSPSLDTTGEATNNSGFFGSFWASKNKKKMALMEAPPPTLKASASLSEREATEVEVISELTRSYKFLVALH